MIQGNGGDYLFFAQDLTAFMDCTHKAALNRQTLTDERLRDWLEEQRQSHKDEAKAIGLPEDPPEITRGEQHEAAHLETLKTSGLSVVEIPKPKPFNESKIDQGVALTLDAMRNGVDVIYQGVLRDGPWCGLADFLIKVEGQSALGEFVYEVHDTKLGRSVKANALIQLAHYGLILETMQGAPPPRLVVVLGDKREEASPFNDVAPYVQSLRTAVLDFHHNKPATTPEPFQGCTSCKWLNHCDEEWGPNDLKHIHRLTRRQRAQLMESGIPDVPALSVVTDDRRPLELQIATFERLRAQAQVQTGVDAFEVIKPQLSIGALYGIPALNDRDIYFDLEGDPFAAYPTLDYLWAFCEPDGTYHCQWAHTPEAEFEAFAWFMDELRTREKEGGEWHVYHYNTYEVTSMQRIADSWPNVDEREALKAEVADFVKNRFDDLYRRIENGLRTQHGSTSLKIVEKLAGYDRSAGAPGDVSKADESIKAYEFAIAEGTDEATRQNLLDGIEGYNQHDVRATAEVHKWLIALGADLQDSDLILVQEEDYEQSDKVKDRIASTQALEDDLTSAMDVATSNGLSNLPSGLSCKQAELLRNLLAWHRKEEVVKWTDFYSLVRKVNDSESDEPIEPDDDELAEAWDLDSITTSTSTGIQPGSEGESILQDIEILKVAHSARKNGKHTYEVKVRPGAWKVKAGQYTSTQPIFDDGRVAKDADVDSHDPRNGLATLRCSSDLTDVRALVLKPFSGGDAPWKSLMRLAKQVLNDEPQSWSATSIRILDQIAPQVLQTETVKKIQDAAEQARTALAGLEAGDSLIVQGPPGTGKTYTSALAILDEIKRLKAQGLPARIAVTANAHKVIENLLSTVADNAQGLGIVLRVAHVGSNIENPDSQLEQLESKDAFAVLSGINGTDALVIGATKNVWAKEEAAHCVDLLVIDEAGQVSLADALSVTHAAPRILAVGDPQQLAAPIQASHAEGAQVSLLAHMIQGEARISPDAGVFLNVSYRMHPAICSVVGELAYESELLSSDKAAARNISGPDLEVSKSNRKIPIKPGVIHIPIPGGQDAEISAVKELVVALTNGSVKVLNSGPDGKEQVTTLTQEQILIVAPHNVTVNQLSHELPTCKIGTVDKFQGQEAHVVIFAMGKTAERATDVPFLYELNRTNVALSRAELLSIVVSSPEALLPPVTQPEHLRLASRFIQALK